jgi:hypothetical protein
MELKDNNKFICCSHTKQYFIYCIGYWFQSLDHHQAIHTATNCYARHTHTYTLSHHNTSKKKTHSCYLIIKTTIYTEDTIDIRHNKET